VTIPHAENAVVDLRKLRNYCLNLEHETGKHKAVLFKTILGMTAKDAEELREILLEIVKTNDAQPGRRDRYGQRYRIDFQPNGMENLLLSIADGLLNSILPFRV
jgi:hypothetical protein